MLHFFHSFFHRKNDHALHSVISMSAETILLFEGDPHILWTLRTALESERYIVIAAHTIEKVLQNLSEFEISAMITDYWNSQKCTFDAVRELKGRFPEAYVMMISDADLEESSYEEMINAGVDDYFVKPFPCRKVLLHLRKGLRIRNCQLQKKRLEETFGQMEREKSMTGLTGAGTFPVGKSLP